MKDRHSDLGEVTGVQKERALERHRRVLQERNALEQELSEIDALREQRQGLDDGADARRAIGADVLWQGWVLQRRASILQQMALCRMREAESLSKARNAFARHEAVQAMVHEAQRSHLETVKKKQTQSIEALSLLLRSPRDG